MERHPAVYILTNRTRGSLYIGVTSSLVARVYEHRNDLFDGFSKRYRLHRLVYYEVHESMYEAISREKRLKEWKREWKIELIESRNPTWKDLWDEISRW